MTERIERKPYDHSLATINEVSANINRIAVGPGGRLRDLDGPTAAGTILAQSNLAIASALLAVADAIRSKGA